MNYSSDARGKTGEFQGTYLAWFGRGRVPFVVTITRYVDANVTQKYEITVHGIGLSVGGYLLCILIVVLGLRVIWTRKRAQVLQRDKAF